MADIVDMATDIQAEHLARSLAAARAPMAPGVAGECDNCGDEFERLVGGLCGFCRDGRRKPTSGRAWVLPPKSQTNAGDEATVKEAAVVEPVSRRDTVARVAETAGETAGGEAAVPASPPSTSSEGGDMASSRRSQINSKVEATDLERLRAMAEAAGTSVSSVASDLILEALAARDGGKPMIRADVIRAARDAGQDLPAFVSSLIVVGLAAHLERAA